MSEIAFPQQGGVSERARRAGLLGFLLILIGGVGYADCSWRPISSPSD